MGMCITISYVRPGIATWWPDNQQDFVSSGTVYLQFYWFIYSKYSIFLKYMLVVHRIIGNQLYHTAIFFWNCCSAISLYSTMVIFLLECFYHNCCIILIYYQNVKTIQYLLGFLLVQNIFVQLNCPLVIPAAFYDWNTQQPYSTRT